MKKILPIIFIVLIIGAGYFFLTTKKQEKSFSEKIKETTDQKKETVVEGIKEMLNKNVSLKCSYETPDGSKITNYLKGKDKFRVKIETKERINEVILINKKMYSWDNQTKQGIIMSVDNIEKPKKTENQNPEKYVQDLETFKAKCDKENFSDDLFQPPTDIKFQDMDKLQEMMKQGNFQVPTINK